MTSHAGANLAAQQGQVVDGRVHVSTIHLRRLSWEARAEGSVGLIARPDILRHLLIGANLGGVNLANWQLVGDGSVGLQGEVR